MQQLTPLFSASGFHHLPILSLLLTLSTLCAGCGGDTAMDDATKHRVAARQAINDGDDALAMQELSAAIEMEPTALSLYERAQLHVKAGNDKAALRDCEAALQLDNENPDIQWYLKELKKPKRQRFHGIGTAPPSNRK